MPIGRNLEETDVFSFASPAKRREFVEALSKFYGKPFSLAGYGDLGFSHTSRKVVVAAPDGQRFVLKRKAFYCRSPEQLQSAAAVQQRVAYATGLAPSLVAGADGSLYFYHEGVPHFLTREVEGRQYNGSLGNGIASSAALARVHLSLCGALGELDPIRPKLSTRSDLEAAKFAGLVGTRVRCSDSAEEKSAQLELIERTLAKLNAAADSAREATESWIHGDPNPFNFLFDLGRTTGLNDFDNACFCCLERDIAIHFVTHTTIYYAGSTTSFRSEITTRAVPGELAAFADAYRSQSDLAIAWSSVPFHMAAHWLELMMLGVVRGDIALEHVCAKMAFLDRLLELKF